MTAAAAKKAKETEAKAPTPEAEKVKMPDFKLSEDNNFLVFDGREYIAVEQANERLEAALEDLRNSEGATDEGGSKDSEGLGNDYFEALQGELEDGVSKSQVLIALESAQARAKEVALIQKSRRDAEAAVEETRHSGGKGE
jgi:hypothetical protein